MCSSCAVGRNPDKNGDYILRLLSVQNKMAIISNM